MHCKIATNLQEVVDLEIDHKEEHNETEEGELTNQELFNILVAFKQKNLKPEATTVEGTVHWLQRHMSMKTDGPPLQLTDEGVIPKKSPGGEHPSPNTRAITGLL